MMSLWIFHIISCDFMSHVNVIWCHMMSYDRICPGHFKLRKTTNDDTHQTFFGTSELVALEFQDSQMTYIPVGMISTPSTDLLRGFVPWFYHWRYQLRTKQRDYIDTYHHTPKKYVKHINTFFVQQKTSPTFSPGDSCSRILSNSLKWPDSTRRSACEGELTEGSHDGCTGRPCVLPRPERGGGHSSGLPSTIHTCLPGNQKMGRKTDGKFMWHIWYVLNLKQEVMVVIQADTLTGWHGPRVYIILYGGKVWQSMVEVPKFGRLQKSKQRLVNVVRAHTSSPIPRRAKIRPGVPTWARWPIIDSCMAIAMIQYRGSQQWDLGDVYTIIILCQFNQLQKNAKQRPQRLKSLKGPMNSNDRVNRHPIDISYIYIDS